MKTRVAVYARVSTDGQEQDGTSLDTQEEACLRHALAQGWVVVQRVRDAASGFSLDRRGLEQVRELVREQACDVVLAYAVDRLSRNQNHVGILFDECDRHGVKLEFVTERFEDNSTGRFILNVRAFVAELEREKIVERTTRGKLARARAGKLPQAQGRGLYGYRYVNGVREVHEAQAGVVRRVFALFVEGVSCARLAKTLNEDGVPAMGGGQWYPLTVRRLLTHEAYVGKTTFRRTRTDLVRDPKTGQKRRRAVERDPSEWVDVPGATPAIVSTELFERAQAILADPSRKRGHGVYKLTGRLKCGECGTPMVGQSLGKGRYRYYRCRNAYTPAFGATRCASRYVACERLEAAVLAEVVAVLTDPDRVAAELRRQAEHVDPFEAGRVKEELADVARRQERLMKLYLDGQLSDDLLGPQAARLVAEKDRLETKLREVEAGERRSSGLLDEVARLPETAARIRKWVEMAEGDRLELLLRALDVQVVATTGAISINGKLPTAVEAAVAAR